MSVQDPVSGHVGDRKTGNKRNKQCTPALVICDTINVLKKHLRCYRCPDVTCVCVCVCVALLMTPTVSTFFTLFHRRAIDGNTHVHSHTLSSSLNLAEESHLPLQARRATTPQHQHMHFTHPVLTLYSLLTRYKLTLPPCLRALFRGK